MATKNEALHGAASQHGCKAGHAALIRSLKTVARCAGTLSLGVLGLAALTSSVAAQNTNAHYLTISAWFDDGTGGGGTSATLSDAEADVMFAGANAVVLPADQQGDIACDHTLGRSGSVVGLHGSGSDGDVDSAEEFDYVLRAPTFVKVVPLISYCGRLEPGIAGCAPVGGGANSLMLAEWAAKSNIGGVALAHEFGHVVGLNHEENLVWNFMQPVASADNRNVSVEQCTLLRSDTLDADGPDMGSTQGPTSFALLAAARVPFSELGSLSIEQLAHSYFFGRTPVEVEDTYGESDLYTLLDLLQHEEERDYHPTIATLIGLLGGAYGDGPADALISYIDTHPGTAASRVALSALGHLAAYGNQYALDTLIINAQPDSFYGPAAVVGLGVSGRVEARGVLQSLSASAVGVATYGPNQAASVAPEQARAATYGPEPSRLHRSTVLEAVSVNQAIASMGRRGYYRD